MISTLDRVAIEDESSSNDDEDETQHYSKRPKMDTFEIGDQNFTQRSPTQNASIGEPKRSLYIWLRVILVSVYVVLSVVATYIMVDNKLISDKVVDALIVITVWIPTLLLFVVLVKPQCISRTSAILLIIVIVLRAIQWIAAFIYVIHDIDNYLFAILGAVINECFFLMIVLRDFYVFYLIKDYDNAIFSIHYNPQNAIRLTSWLLFISSILWFIHCYHIYHSSQTKFIDAWFYLLMTIITTVFLIFEYVLEAKWGNKLGFLLCCVLMLLILFIWGDDNLLSFSDIATAAILPQMFSLCFAYFNKFATECM